LFKSLMKKATPKISEKRGVLDITSVAPKGTLFQFRTTIFLFFAPVKIYIEGSGGTVGPEEPAAQLGGGIASKITTLLRFSDQRRRVFTAAGAAFAVIFNTPLEGVFLL
jgi:chloride channel protein, CIC family